MIEKALKTWYPKEHHLHFDPMHPAIKLAGEAGELLDLYGKHQYKPNFDWWNCKRCNRPKIRGECPGGCVPMVLDELGDLWYYLRILSYISDKKLENKRFYSAFNIAEILTTMNVATAQVANNMVNNGRLDTNRLMIVYDCLLSLLLKLNFTIHQLTELNYRKLNSEPTNHGWADAA